MVLTVQKTSEIPQLQILEIPVVDSTTGTLGDRAEARGVSTGAVLGRFVGMPVVEAPLVLTVQKPVEIQRVQILGKCCNDRCPWS